MLKILKTTNQEDIKRLQNKKVLDIIEMDEWSPTLGGYFKSWQGSTHEEYFSILYVKGLLSVSLEEREMFLGKFPVNYALDGELIDLMSKNKNDQAKLQKAADAYNRTGYLKTYKELTLAHVLKILKWRKAKKTKVQQGMFFSY